MPVAANGHVQAIRSKLVSFVNAHHLIHTKVPSVNVNFYFFMKNL